MHCEMWGKISADFRADLMRSIQVPDSHENRQSAISSRKSTMAIPLSYNFRNLRVRKTTTVMTALGIALTVAVLLGILAMVAAQVGSSVFGESSADDRGA